MKMTDFRDLKKTNPSDKMELGAIYFLELKSSLKNESIIQLLSNTFSFFKIKILKVLSFYCKIIPKKIE